MQPNGITVPRPFDAMGAASPATLSLTELFEEYDATVYENGPLGMRMIKIKEVSSVTGGVDICFRSHPCHLMTYFYM